MREMDAVDDGDGAGGIEHDVGMKEGDEFDAIFTHEVLEHVPEPEETLQYMVYHLKPKGILYFTMCFHGSGCHLKQNIQRYNAEKWAEIMEKMGLESLGDNFDKKRLY